MGEAVVSCGDSAEVLEAPEHALDGVAAAVEIGREAILPAAIGLGRDVGCGALALDLATDGIAVIPLVAVQDFGAGHLVEQGIGGGTVGDLAAGQQERDRTAEAIGQRVDLRRPPAAGTADRLREFPPLAPEAQR
jgi:hypothetical protein